MLFYISLFLCTVIIPFEGPTVDCMAKQGILLILLFQQLVCKVTGVSGNTPVNPVHFTAISHLQIIEEKYSYPYELCP